MKVPSFAKLITEQFPSLTENELRELNTRLSVFSDALNNGLDFNSNFKCIEKTLTFVVGADGFPVIRLPWVGNRPDIQCVYLQDKASTVRVSQATISHDFSNGTVFITGVAEAQINHTYELKLRLIQA